MELWLKPVACSAPWGVALLVADGVHEEGVTFCPGNVELAWAEVLEFIQRHLETMIPGQFAQEIDDAELRQTNRLSSVPPSA